MSQQLSLSVLIREVLHGPYAGYVTRIAAEDTLVRVKPLYGDYPLEPHRVVHIDGQAGLRYAPHPPKD
jgi:hypothetical protein